MLPRILEPEVMDTYEDARDYDEMDHRAVNQLFVSDLLAFAKDTAALAGDLLDLGTGTAQIPIEFCRQCPTGRIMAVDAAIEMLEIARYNLELASQTSRVQLAHIDAKRLPYPAGMFAVVMSNSIVHHIPEPAGALAEAVRVLAPGGVIFFRDLLRPASNDELEQLVATYAAGCNEHQRALFAASLHAALTLEELQALVVPLGFAAETVQQTSDRHWTWAARLTSA
ncbi:MAG TPA: class I SAM-dependent methyltransferase [Pirellulaceae bacterium]|nr:class I SAM-dependent methyltransferase [Pirellulaceae bacterium]